MTAVIARVASVTQHPDAPHLDIVAFDAYPGVVSMKVEDGSPRYAKDDLVVYVAEGSIVPDDLLRDGFWDEDAGKGILAGPKGNRVKASNFRGVRSHAILFGCGRRLIDVDTGEMGEWVVFRGAVNRKEVLEGDDVSEFLGITG